KIKLVEELGYRPYVVSQSFRIAFLPQEREQRLLHRENEGRSFGRREPLPGARARVFPEPFAGCAPCLPSYVFYFAELDGLNKLPQEPPRLVLQLVFLDLPRP